MYSEQACCQSESLFSGLWAVVDAVNKSCTKTKRAGHLVRLAISYYSFKICRASSFAAEGLKLFFGGGSFGAVWGKLRGFGKLLAGFIRIVGLGVSQTEVIVH